MRLSHNPVRVKLPGSNLPVTIDAGKFLLAVRAALSMSGSASTGWLPAAIRSAAAGHIAWQLRGFIAGLPAVFEYGYQPGAEFGRFSLGAYMSDVCRDEAPFTNRVALAISAARNPAFSVLANNPYLAACKVWDVPPGERQMDQPVTTSIPVLVLTGQFDAFSPAPVVEAATKSFGRAWDVQIPWQIHNVLGGSGCALTIRNRWLDRPTRPPDTACSSSIRPPPFAASTG